MQPAAARTTTVTAIATVQTTIVTTITRATTTFDDNDQEIIQFEFEIFQPESVERNAVLCQFILKFLTQMQRNKVVGRVCLFVWLVGLCKIIIGEMLFDRLGPIRQILL